MLPVNGGNAASQPDAQAGAAVHGSVTVSAHGAGIA